MTAKRPGWEEAQAARWQRESDEWALESFDAMTDNPADDAWLAYVSDPGLSEETIRLRDRCREILAEIQPASVRAVCYRLFTEQLLPDMSKRSTTKISSILTRAREGGFIPWAWIIDELRERARRPPWSDPADAADATKRDRDRWRDQPRRVEVWSDKGTLRGILMPVLLTYGVGFRLLRGHTSITAFKEVALATQGDLQPLRALYLGDYTPTGLHRSEVDIPMRAERYGARFEVARLALTPDDLCRPEVAPTRFPATEKGKDPWYQWFVDRYGEWCWELDALSPVIVRERVEAAIEAAIGDVAAWNRAKLISGRRGVGKDNRRPG